MVKLLEPDVYQRAAWPGVPDTAPRRRVADGVVFGAMMAVSLALIVASQLELPWTVAVRATIEDAASLVLRLATSIAAPVFSFGRQASAWHTAVVERDQLQRENDQLRQWQARAQMLQQDVAALSKLTHVVADQPWDSLTARVISGNGGPFVRVAMLDAGREQGVKAGFPAMSGQGLVGRVVAAGRVSARLLLLTDINSRIPVMIGADGRRALLQGDNSPLPKIAYLPPGSGVHPGDQVFTSGVGGLFPRGLPVGKVVDTGAALRIEPSAHLDRLDYVSVVVFETVSAALTQDEKAVEARAGLQPDVRAAGGITGGVTGGGMSWFTSAGGGLGR